MDLQSRIDELEEELEKKDEEIEELNDRVADLEDEIEELEDKDCDCPEEGKEYEICGETVSVVCPGIAHESFFERLSEASKKWKSVNHFIKAIEKL